LTKALSLTVLRISRDKNGEISRKQDNPLIRTLRKTYGANFAKGCGDEELSDVLHRMDEPSLSHLVRDHEAGKLDQIARSRKRFDLADAGAYLH
jgi:hypothetical protein